MTSITEVILSGGSLLASDLVLTELIQRLGTHSTPPYFADAYTHTGGFPERINQGC